LISVQEKYKSEAAFFVKKVDHPDPFGVVQGKLIENGVYSVERIVEKPTKPLSKIAVVAYYLFSPEIFSALNSINLDLEREIHLTYGI
jgi:dTDP-glucose pyrophosphorylase